MLITRKFLKAVAVCLLVAAGVRTANGRVIYVDDDAVGLGSGARWADAYVYLQDALAEADAAGEPVEIRVAAGRYRPDQGANQEVGGVHATFELRDGVTLKGGYAGLGGIDPNERDVATYETILHGDLDGDDDDWAGYDNNVQVVVTSTHNDATAVLDGFTVTGGNGWSGPGLSCYGSAALINACTFRTNRSIGREGGYGGAMYISEGAPMLTDCAFEKNWAMADGGAIWNQSGGKLTLVGCTFAGNITRYRGGAVACFYGDVNAVDCSFTANTANQGGALYVHQGDVLLAGCAFTGNTAGLGGGGIYNLFCSMAITACTFGGNQAIEGGGLYNDSSRTVTLTGSLVAGNLASYWGGGMYNWCESQPVLSNCTFADNRAAVGAGLAAGRPVLVNCIVWSQEADAVALHPLGEGPAVRFSCIQGGWPGAGNSDADPLFAAPGTWAANGTPDDPSDDLWEPGDYHLTSQAGRWDPAGQAWVIDEATSPCIDAGDPNDPVGDEPLPNGGRINMGTYGGTARASLSPGKTD